MIRFEVEHVQQIWRRPECTFTVTYPTKKMVCVKGLRGKFTYGEYKALNNIFWEMGYRKAVFERDIDGRLVEQVRTLKPPFSDTSAITFERTK